jgi:hypothetical protein
MEREMEEGKRGRKERGHNTYNYPAIGALDRGGTSRRSWRDGSTLAARDHLFAVSFAAQAALRTAVSDAGSTYGRRLELHSCARRC